jgi:hypothetical protein
MVSTAVNKNTPPIVSRLQALQVPSRLAPGGARVIATLSDPSPLAALLREVNETVLGRVLTFETSGGSSLALEVSGRRVLRLVAANGLVGAENCLAAPALEDEHKDDLIKLLQTVAAPRHELRVSTLPTPREREAVSIGLPAALLADLLLIELNPVGQEAPAEPMAVQRFERDAPVPEEKPVGVASLLGEKLAAINLEPEPEPELEEAVAEISVPVLLDPEGAMGGPDLASFARSFGPTLMAWLIQGGADDGASDGAEEMVSHLGGFLGDEASDLGKQLDLLAGQPGGPICIVLGAALVAGNSILCARKDGGMLLGLVDGDATRALMRAWSKVVG